MTAAADPDIDWRAHAACRDHDPALFFPGPDQSAEPAKAICATCPVRVECLNAGLADPHEQGVWGGHTESERRRIRRRGGPGLPPVRPDLGASQRVLDYQRTAGPRTAREIVVGSNYRGPKIYGTLGSLVRQGLVRTNPGSPNTYEIVDQRSTGYSQAGCDPIERTPVPHHQEP